MNDLTKRKNGGCGCGGSSTSHGCKCGCQETSGCGVTTLVRPRFFPGQLLLDGDLQLLADYSLLKHRLHNRFLHGDGVVCGLLVGCHPCGGGKVVVGPGMALDCCGNDILVPCPTELDINAMIRELRLSLQPGYDCGDPCDKKADPKDSRRRKNTYCLWIKYCEELTDPVSPYMSDDPCSSIGCQSSRVREGHTFELRCPQEEEPPDSLWSRIACCVGDLELADRAANDANAVTYYSDRAEFAAYQVYNKAPVPFDADDITVMKEATQSLERFGRQPLAANAALKPLSEIEVRRGLDDLQAAAAAVVRWDLQSRESMKKMLEQLNDVEDAVGNARAAVREAAPFLADAAPKVLADSPRDAMLAAETTAQAMRWTAEADFNEADAVQRQFFAYNAMYSPKTLASMAQAMNQLRDWLLRAIDKRGLFADCKLRDEVLNVRIPDTNAANTGTLRRPAVELVSAFLRYLIDCVCAAINPPCQPCEDAAVKLACLDVEDCEVIKICNLERKYVLSGPALRYWIPFLHQFGELLEKACCKFALKLRAPEPRAEIQSAFRDRRSLYFRRTAPVSRRVTRGGPEIATILRLLNVKASTIKLAANFGGYIGSMLLNQPVALQWAGQFSGLESFELPRRSRSGFSSETEWPQAESPVKERTGARETKTRASKTEKNK
jgi:hypothetical protein